MSLIGYVRHGGGAPLVLVHGLGARLQSWEHTVLPGLAAAREVISVDVPGHGQTPALTGALTFDRLVGDLQDFPMWDRPAETVEVVLGATA